MKQLILSLIVILAINTLLPETAKAKKYPFQGVQIQTVLAADLQLPRKSLKLTIQGSYFTQPENNIHLFFSYFGIQWQVTKWFWISPKWGVAANWNGEFPVIASLWMGFSLYKNFLTLFIEGEGYLNQNFQDYYGYYALECSPLSWLEFGIQGEQINQNIMFGPHVNFTYKSLTVGLQYFFGAQKDVLGHAARIFLKLQLPTG